MASTTPNLLFIINPGSGNDKTDWRTEIESFFSGKSMPIELYELPNPCRPDILKKVIDEKKPSSVIAVGGDGTVKLVAECLVGTSIPLGILPAGSANGMAKEFGISDDPLAALETIVNGQQRKIHLIKVNSEFCIHLSDIGFNAYVVKKFEDDDTRGMWGYVKAAWKVLWKHSKMRVEIKTDKDSEFIEAEMVVIANATRYGNGVVINPEGSLFDELFEVVIVKKISFSEIMKMRFTQREFNEKKTVLYQTSWLKIESKHRVHFQVDGEYRGKVNQVNAEVIPAAVYVIIPIDQ